MRRRSRRRHSPAQKAARLRKHLVEKKPESEICSEAGIKPSVLYNWERDRLEAAPGLFATRRGAGTAAPPALARPTSGGCRRHGAIPG